MKYFEDFAVSCFIFYHYHIKLWQNEDKTTTIRMIYFEKHTTYMFTLCTSVIHIILNSDIVSLI